MTTEEEIPEEGEKSYGMQLNGKFYRDLSCEGLLFSNFFV